MYNNQVQLISDLQHGMSKLEQMSRSPQAIRFGSAPFGMPTTNQIGLTVTNNNLGWLLPALAIAGTVIQGGVSAYGIHEQSKLEEQRLEMEQDLQDRQMKLQEDLAAIQKKIMNLQAEHLAETQAIAIEVEKARAELEKAKIEFELEQVKREQALYALRSSIEFEKLTIEQEALTRMKEERIEAEYQIKLKEKAAEVKIRETELEQKVALAEGNVVERSKIILYATGATGLIAVALLAYKRFRG